MASDRRQRSGQAMTEFVIAILAMILIILAMVEFLPVFLENIGLLKEVREEAGTAAIASDAGTSAADRQDEFRADIPEFLLDSDDTSGSYSEKLRLPAANLADGEFVRIPNDTKQLTDEQRESVQKLIDKIEEDEDVQNVFTNMAE